MPDHGQVTQALIDDTAETILRAVWAITDGESPIPPEAVERLAAEYGVELRPRCDTCHEVDGHTTDCADGICHVCDPNPCQCDNLYELAVGK